jgi:dimethylargininase
MMAVTRPVGPAIRRCALSHLERRPIDTDRAVAQHAAYETALRELGCRVVRVPEAPTFPDAVFIEDTAVVTDELAVVTRPGAASRRGEVAPVAALLTRFRVLRRIRPPATLDGGDVLIVGRDVFVGASARSNQAGAAALQALLGPLGYIIHRVPVTGCLHLKTAVTALTDDTLLLNPEWVAATRFQGYHVVEVDPGEPFAANVLRVGDTLLASAANRATNGRLAALGWHVRAVDLSELAKAEGGVTCGCLLVREDRDR